MVERSIVAYCAIFVTLAAGCGDDNRDAAPVVADLAVTTPEDTPVAVTVTVTAVDLSAVTLAVVTPPQHGALSGTGPTWTYTPAANYDGTDSAVVVAADSHGSTTATVSFMVTAVNDAPVANPDSLATAFNTPLTVAQTTLLANDIDVDSASLSVTAVTSGVHGSVALDGSNIVFTPETGFQGTATFGYTISDGMLTAQGTVTVAVGTDLPPVAVADAVIAAENTTLLIGDATLLANDHDPEGQTLAIAIVGNAVHGSVTHTGTQVSFVPESGFVGAAGFDYTVTDGMLTAVTTVVVTVTAVDQPPVAVADVATVAQGSTASALDVLANDSDVDGGPKAVASVSQPARGVAAVGAGGTSVTYTPADGYCNQAPNTPPDTFSYTLAPGGSSATVAVTVTCTCGLHQSTDFVVGSK